MRGQSHTASYQLGASVLISQLPASFETTSTSDISEGDDEDDNFNTEDPAVVESVVVLSMFYNSAGPGDVDICSI